jgi:hypothetical protein
MWGVLALLLSPCEMTGGFSFYSLPPVAQRSSVFFSLPRYYFLTQPAFPPLSFSFALFLPPFSLNRATYFFILPLSLAN